MAINIPNTFFDGMTPKQVKEMFGVLKSLDEILTREQLEMVAQQSTQQFSEYDVLGTPQGHTFINTGTRLAGDYAGPAAVSSTETALELAQDAYDASVLDANGSVIYRYSTGQGALSHVEQGSTVYNTASLMSLDLGMVGAAVAPLLGVSLGAGLATSNPEFWTKLSQKLLPFCYDNTTIIPGWVDIVESALVPGDYVPHGIIDKAIYDTLKAWFEEEGIGNPRDEHKVDDNPDINSPLIWREINEGLRIEVGGNEYVLLRRGGSGPIRVAYYADGDIDKVITAAEQSSTLRFYNEHSQGWSMEFSATNSYTKDGKTVYYSVSETGSDFYRAMNRTLLRPSAFQDALRALLSWYLLYAASTPTGGYPTGTSKWNGNHGLDEYTKSIVRFDTDPETGDVTITESPAVEITIQEKKDTPSEGDDSYSSPDPEDEPNPDSTAKPENILSNLESTAPGNNTDPVNESQPDPETDPSQAEQSISPTIPVIPPASTVAPPNTAPPGTTPPGTEPPPDDSGSSPAIVTPVIPLPFSSANDGLISVYHPTDAQLKSFASWLWVTYSDPSIEKLWNNPFDGVIGLMEIYCTPTDVGAKNIRSGFLDSQISAQTISRYTEINCGTVFIPEYYHNYFDYSPYSKCHIYLPFIGIVELNVDDIVDHGVNVTYKIDEYNGSCISQITIAKYTEVNGTPVTYNDLMYQFSGNCAVELPLAGGTQSAIRAGMIQAAAYGISSVIGGIVSGVSGNIGGAISQVGYGAANAIGSVVSAKSSVQHSGSFGSSYGALGGKKPFITITRPKQLCVYNYPELYGYPAHCSVTIGACEGFLRVVEVNVKSATASNDEKHEIERLLKEGVYV